MKIKLYKIFCILIIISSLFISKIYAYDKADIKIFTGNLQNKVKTVDLWKMSSKEFDKLLKMNNNEIKNYINELKYENDSEKFNELSKPYKQMSFINGVCEFSLEEGLYYYKASSNKPISSGIIFVRNNENQEIYLKENFINYKNTLKIVKYLDKKSSNTRASGIVFRLYKKQVDTTIDELVRVSNSRYDKFSKEYNLVTDNKGEIIINNLPNGIYRLEEIKTKNRYKLINPIEFELIDNKTIEIVNKLDKDLPSTGVYSNYKYVVIFAISLSILLISFLRRNDR